MSDQNSENLLTGESSSEKSKEGKTRVLEISKRKMKDPAFLWKFGFPGLLALVLIWSSFLLVDGFSSVLKSEEGAIREAITDPFEEGFEAFVEQTWAELVVTEDESGGLVQVAVISIADRQIGGGTILLLPPELKLNQCVGNCTLDSQYLNSGLESIRNSISDLLETEFSGSTTLTPERWETLIEPMGTVAMRIEETGEIQTVKKSEVFNFISQEEEGNFLFRQKNQGDFWRSWISGLVESGDIDGSLPLMRIPVVELISALANAPFAVVDNLWYDLGNGPETKPDLMSGLIHDMFPFPAATENDERATVRLLNGTDDHSLSAEMQRLLRENGANITVLGNFRSFNVIQTRVIYKDTRTQTEAERLAAAIGAHVIKDELVSPVADFTVLIGRDFSR
jgi:hypothetical protein